MSSAIKKKIILHIPYAVAGLLATNFGEAWRLTAGVDPSRKVLTLMTTLQTAFANPLPSFHPFDLMVGVICALAFYLAVYMRGKMQRSTVTIRNTDRPAGERIKTLSRMRIRSFREM